MKTRGLRSFYTMTVAQIKLTFRNRQALFWSLVFPLLFIFLFGSIFQDDSTSFKIALIDKDKSEISKQLVEAIEKVPVYKISEGKEQDEIAQLKKGKRSLVIVIPAGYAEAFQKSLAPGASPAPGTSLTPGGVNPSQTMQGTPQPPTPAAPPAEVKVYYDGTNLSQAQIALASFREVTNGINQQLRNFQPVIVAKTEALKAKNLKYIEFLIPGILAMMLMQSNIFGISFLLANWRQQGILKRISATPMPRSALVVSRIIAGLITVALQLAIIVGVARFIYNVKIQGSIPALIVLSITGAMAFMALGYVVGSFGKTEEAVQAIGNLVSMPMMFLGGVFFPVDSAPSWLQPFIKIIPVTYLGNGLRDIFNSGGGFAEIQIPMLVLGGWMAACLVIGTLRFKWSD